VAEVNPQVIHKLRQYPKQVADVAIAAVQAASELPKSAVEEKLSSIIRKSVRNQGGSE
jgi:hypothetical protein